MPYQITKLAKRLYYYARKGQEPYTTLWQLRYRLRQLRRNERGTANIGKWVVEYVDARSLASMWDYQFIKKHNDFYSTKEDPIIIDCGSNIGVSVMRYKNLYPRSRIIAFEPDASLCEVLRRNVKYNELTDVTVIQAAIWTKDGEISFTPAKNGNSEAGQISILSNIKHNDNTMKIKTEWLGKFLDQPIDFVKLDVEGAELEVLKSCRHLLLNVKQMAIEVHHQVDRVEFLSDILQILASAKFNVAIYQGVRFPNPEQPFHPQVGRTGDQYPVLWAWR